MTQVSISISGYVPKELIDIDAVRLELLNALRAEGREIRRDLKKTVKTWKHKVDFKIKVSLRRTIKEGSVTVSTDDEIYGWVNDGTRRHPMGPIRPRGKAAGGADVLKIPKGGIRPKTRPGKLTSYKGGPKGPYAFAMSTKRFMHPGTKPRLFTEAVKRRIERTRRFKKRIDTAIAKGLAKDKGTKIIK